MTIEEKNKIIIDYLKSKGFKPRENSNIKEYIRQLNTRLSKQGKRIYIEESQDNVSVSIQDKKDTKVRDKSLFARVTEEEMERYKKLAENRHTDLSKLIRDLLDRECDNE